MRSTADQSPARGRVALSPSLPARLNDPARLLSIGAAVGLATMAASSSGDTLVAGVLLGLAAADLAAGCTGVLVAAAVAGRWGLTSFAALAGGQAVIGAAGWSGSPAMVVSSWAAAAAVLMACPRSRGSSDRPAQAAEAEGEVGQEDRRHTGGVFFPGVVASGVYAAALVAGPAAGRDPAPEVALRVGASLVGIAAAVMVTRAVPAPTARVLALLAAASAAVIALLA